MDRDNDTAVFSGKEADLSSKLAAAHEEIRLLRIFKNTRSVTRDTPQEQIREEEEEGSDDDSFYETTPLSDNEGDVTNEEQSPRPIQRRAWILRHSGSTRLAISALNINPYTPMVNECISFRDDNGLYTTYIHLDVKCRVTGVERLLSDIEGLIDYKIVRIRKGHSLQSSRHFWKIASAIRSKHRSLKMERMVGIGQGQRSLFKEFMTGDQPVQQSEPAHQPLD